MRYSEEQLASACMTYQHDFGIATPSIQDSVRRQMAQILEHLPEPDLAADLAACRMERSHWLQRATELEQRLGACPDRQELADALALEYDRHPGPDGEFLAIADKAIELCAGRVPAPVWDVLTKCRDNARACGSERGIGLAWKLAGDDLEAALKSVPREQAPRFQVTQAQFEDLCELFCTKNGAGPDCTAEAIEAVLDELRVIVQRPAEPAPSACTKELAQDVLDTMHGRAFEAGALARAINKHLSLAHGRFQVTAKEWAHVWPLVKDRSQGAVLDALNFELHGRPAEPAPRALPTDETSESILNSIGFEDPGPYLVSALTKELRALLKPATPDAYKNRDPLNVSLTEPATPEAQAEDELPVVCANKSAAETYLEQELTHVQSLWRVESDEYARLRSGLEELAFECEVDEHHDGDEEVALALNQCAAKIRALLTPTGCTSGSPREPGTPERTDSAVTKPGEQWATRVERLEQVLARIRAVLGSIAGAKPEHLHEYDIQRLAVDLDVAIDPPEEWIADYALDARKAVGT